MPNVRLTKRIVEAADAPATGDLFLWDEQLPGFGCRVFASGKRSYLVQYRAAGRSRRVTIGLHGRLSVDQARVEARHLLGQVAKGGNPADVRARDREAVTVAELCDRYVEAAGQGLIFGKRGRPKRGSTLAIDRGRIERHIKPLLGRRRVIDLVQADIARFLRDVAAGKTAADVKTKKQGRAIVTGGRGTATRTAGLLGGILAFAVGEGIRADNPVHGVPRFADGRRRLALEAEQYRKIGEALEAAEPVLLNAVAAVRVIALTGCRRQEVLTLTWPAVDEPGGCFRLAETKEGESIRPVGKAAFDVLRTLPRSNSSAYVLPGDGREGFYAGLPKAWDRIKEHGGLDVGLTLHGLRHAFASIANELGYTEATIAALLGHSAKRSVTAGYTHHVDAVLVAAADNVAAKIAAMMAGR